MMACYARFPLPNPLPQAGEGANESLRGFQLLPLFWDRDEEEVRGYRDALKLIHEGAARMPVSEATICELHRLARGQIWDAGQ